jgi:nitroreductase
MTDSLQRRELEFLRTLRSTRQFTGEPLPQPVIDNILEIARWSGSAKNVQPWHFVIIRNRATLNSIANSGRYTGHVAHAAAAIAIVLDNEYQDWESFDEGRLSERIMLAAHAQGVGSCVGWLEPEAASFETKALLSIPANYRIRTIISLGYPVDSPRTSASTNGQSRKSLEQIVSYERFDPTNES